MPVPGTSTHTTSLLLFTSLFRWLFCLCREWSLVVKYKTLSFSNQLPSASSIIRLQRRACGQGFYCLSLAIRIWLLSHGLLDMLPVTWGSDLSPFIPSLPFLILQQISTITHLLAEHPLSALPGGRRSGVSQPSEHTHPVTYADTSPPALQRQVTSRFCGFSFTDLPALCVDIFSHLSCCQGQNSSLSFLLRVPLSHFLFR